MSNDRWQSQIEREIQRAIHEGQITDLPGAGKPLDLNDDPYTPSDQRMAYKIMRDNDVAPDWMMLGKTLERKADELRVGLRSSVREHREALINAHKVGSGEARFREHAQRQLEVRLRGLRQRTERYNQEILTYNLKIPHGISQRRIFDFDRELQIAQAED